VLIYYPGGVLRSPDEGIAAFDSDALRRLGRLYPEAQWWPLAVHVTWTGDARPVAFLKGGPAHDLDGTEHDRLTTLWDHLRRPDRDSSRSLLRGRRSASEIWSLSFTAPFFRWYL
jgi:hypothetical protein